MRLLPEPPFCPFHPAAGSSRWRAWGQPPWGRRTRRGAQCHPLQGEAPLRLAPKLVHLGLCCRQGPWAAPGCLPSPTSAQPGRARLSTKPQAFPLGHRLPISEVPILLQAVPGRLPHPEGSREGCSASTAHTSLLPAVGLCVSGLTSLNLCSIMTLP